MTKDITNNLFTNINKDSDIEKFLFDDITSLIEKAKSSVATHINTTLVQLNWNIGKKLKKTVLKKERAEYGQEIVSSLSRQLTFKYGTGYSRVNLFHMIKFYEIFPDEQIVYSLSRQLSWTHFRHLMYINDQIKREFYTEIAQLEHWNTRTLKKKIDGMLYERTGISHKPEQLAIKELKELRETKALTTPDLTFRDPYVLDFLSVSRNYSETDLEHAILNEIESFIAELGTDFCFVARQKRICIGKKDHYLDLLFFHRSMQKLIALELKLGTFHAHYKGQMELYLKWLDKYERRPNEQNPVGIILCADKDQDEIELLELDKSGIHVAQYLTELPPKKLLEDKLKQAIAIAREKHEKLQVLKDDNEQ